MSPQRPLSWHQQPDLHNLSPDSYTAQRLVNPCGLQMIDSTADKPSNMPRQNISTSPRGASLLAPSPYAPAPLPPIRD